MRLLLLLLALHDLLLLLLVLELLWPRRLFSASLFVCLQAFFLPLLAAQLSRTFGQTAFILVTRLCNRRRLASSGQRSLGAGLLDSGSDRLSVFGSAAGAAPPRRKLDCSVAVWLTRKIAGSGEVVLHFQISPLHDLPRHNGCGASVVHDVLDHGYIPDGLVSPMNAIKPIFVDNHNPIDVDVSSEIDVSDVFIVDHAPGSPITPAVIHFVGRYRNPADMAATVNPRDTRRIPRHVPPSARHRRSPVPTVIEKNPASVMMSDPTKALVGHPQLLARPVCPLTNGKWRPVGCDVSRSPVMGGFTAIRQFFPIAVIGQDLGLRSQLGR